MDGRQLARVPREFGYYNQCQPAIWKLDYYASLLTEAVRRGIVDPWTFERFSLPDQPQHYVSEYTWPSRHCGFRRRGRVYLRALYSMKLPEGKALHDELLRERFPRVPLFLRQVIGQVFALWGWRGGCRSLRAAAPLTPLVNGVGVFRPVHAVLQFELQLCTRCWNSWDIVRFWSSFNSCVYGVNCASARVIRFENRQTLTSLALSARICESQPEHHRDSRCMQQQG